MRIDCDRLLQQILCSVYLILPKFQLNLYDLTEKDDADAIINAIDTVSPESQSVFYAQCLKKLRRRYVEKELKKAASELNAETNENRKTELKRRIIELTKLNK